MNAVPLIIGFYMFISAALLVFNIWYIARHRGDDNRHWKKTRKWLREIKRQVRAMADVPGPIADKAHIDKLAKKLQSLAELTAYDDALGRASQFFTTGQIRSYLQSCMPSFRILTVAYARFSDMEKAYYMQGTTRHLAGLETVPIHDDQLYPFLANSNVFCRENTLRLLYAMGDADMVRRAFDILAEKDIFHHETLLTAGLMSFCGDKGALAGSLLEKVNVWPEPMGVAVIRFIEACGADFRQPFFAAIGSKGLGHEVRVAILRYFGNYPFGPMLPTLLSYLRITHRSRDDLAVAAAVALGAYPGKESIGALKDALSSRNWEVRNSAAKSLMMLEATESDLGDVISGQDRFAREMFCYHVQAQEQDDRFPFCSRSEMEA